MCVCLPASICVTDSKWMLTAYEMNCLFTALRVCQSVNYEMLSRKHQEFKQYSSELCSCITMMETKLAQRLFQRSQLFPTVCYSVLPLNKCDLANRRSFVDFGCTKVDKIEITLTGVMRHVSCMFLLNQEQ